MDSGSLASILVSIHLRKICVYGQQCKQVETRRESLLRPLLQDVFVWGPPCQPYSKLNSQRSDPTFCPLDTKEAQPFVLGSRHIRYSAMFQSGTSVHCKTLLDRDFGISKFQLFNTIRYVEEAAALTVTHCLNKQTSRHTATLHFK